jgi:hypothetical protein
MRLRDVEAPTFYRQLLTGGGEVFRLRHRAALYPPPPRMVPGTHFSHRLSGPQTHSAAGRIRSIEKSNELVGYRTRGLPSCSIVPQPATLPRATSI